MGGELDRVGGKLTFSSSWEVIKYGHRALNLAVFFVRHRIPLHQNERSGNRAYSGADLGSVELRVA